LERDPSTSTAKHQIWELFASVVTEVYLIPETLPELERWGVAACK